LPRTCRSPLQSRSAPYGIMVFAMAGARIGDITAFADNPELFEVFELPTELN
jgi:hypothetical protein